MAIGEGNTAASVDDEVAGVSGSGRLGVEGASGGGSEDDDSGDDVAELFKAVVGGGNVP